jgi:rhamnulokinase
MGRYLAIDLGAESGRVILGTLDGARLELEELHRFANEPVRLPSGLYWDVPRLWLEIQRGLAAAGRRRTAIDGIGVCTWGVDFALLSSDGALAGLPRHYRDTANDGMVERTCAIISRRRIYELTGVQFLQINSLHQLHSMKRAGSPALGIASRLLFMPDLFAYFLCGETMAERTIASTSQFYNPQTGDWAFEIFDALGLPKNALPRIVSPGTRLGTLRPEAAAASGLPAETPVYATAGHDTAAAVAGTPAMDGPAWCYISSGTWSLMGVERDGPVISPRAEELNFTNEAGVDGTIRLLKNIMGLWPLQECRRAWQSEGLTYSYAELTDMARAEPEFPASIDIDEFLEPGRMPERIAAACARSGQPQPQTHAQFVRLVLQSLAEKYGQVLESLEELIETRIQAIHIVGGGSQNGFLNRLVEQRTGRPVIAGPVEATAAGNILTQALGAGEVSSLAHMRKIVRESALP